MPLAPGSKLGPYEIVDALGAGGMGEVYRARDTRLERQVAIKVLPGHLSDHPEARQRLEREARAVSDLSHPHICTLHDIGHEGGVDYLVMELLEGRPLSDRLTEGPLPADEALRYAVQLAGALDAAHQKGLIHRDLKPGNIMLTEAGVKLLDFGLAKSAALAGAEGGLTAAPTMTTPLTAEGSIVGTFQYMSPEQLEGKEADARSDVFSFGAVLYEMLTGRRAFAGDNQASLIASIMKEDPRPASAVSNTVPRAIDRLIRRCLAKQPGDRWQTARDLKLELTWIAEGGARDEEDEPAAPRSAPWLPWTVAALAAAAAIFFMLRSPAPEPQGAIRLTVPVPAGTDFGDDLASPPVISPDGKTIAFGVLDESGEASLWLRSMDAFDARPLPNTEGATYAFWSPDSRHVGFHTAGKIKRVEVATGRVQTVTDIGYPRGGSWSADGKILFAPNSNSGIHIVDAAGGPAKQLTTPDPDVVDSSHRWPCFLPDDKHYLYVFWTNDPEARAEHGGVFLADIEGDEEPRRLLHDASSVAYVPPGYLLVARGENLIAVPFDAGRREVNGEAVIVAEGAIFSPGNGYSTFSASSDTLVYAGGDIALPSRLLWYDRNGGVTPVPGEPTPYFNLQISPDERRAAATISGDRTATGEIWVVDLVRGVRTPLSQGPAYHDYPIWAPSGDRVAFGSQKTGTFNFYTTAADGSGGMDPLYETDRDKALYDWSSDGKYVAFFGAGVWSASPDIWIYEVDEDRAVPFSEGEATYDEAKFSPDSRFIAYTSNESGRFEVYIQAFGGVGEDGAVRGGRWQVSTGGGTTPHWRDDGGELVYVDLDRRMMAVSVNEQPGGLVLGTPEELFVLPPRVPAWDGSGDHTRFLVAERGETATEPLHVVVNWREDL